jgi:surface carbohydrate biosynthesis protein
MATSKRPFLILVENEIRSLEAKLLLACVAADRGFPTIIGSRPQLQLRIAHLPRGSYLAKNVAPSSEQMFSILRKLGHEIVVWIEDALLHPPPAHFFETRVSERASSQVSHAFA